MTATADTPPQRFRWRRHSSIWSYGVCVFCPQLESWEINTSGIRENAWFDNDPWEVMGKIIGDAAVFEWIDNDMGWRGFEGGECD